MFIFQKLPWNHQEQNNNMLVGWQLSLLDLVELKLQTCVIKLQFWQLEMVKLQLTLMIYRWQQKGL
jgi:hypothetical protein